MKHIHHFLQHNLKGADIYEIIPVKDYPNDATFGTVLKAPKEMNDVRAQVVADYQEALEQGWLAILRERFPVEVDKNVLATVNKH